MEIMSDDKRQPTISTIPTTTPTIFTVRWPNHNFLHTENRKRSFPSNFSPPPRHYRWAHHLKSWIRVYEQTPGKTMKYIALGTAAVLFRKYPVSVFFVSYESTDVRSRRTH